MQYARLAQELAHRHAALSEQSLCAILFAGYSLLRRSPIAVDASDRFDGAGLSILAPPVTRPDRASMRLMKPVDDYAVGDKD